GAKIWLTDDVELESVLADEVDDGFIKFTFKNGSMVVIGFESLKSGDKKDTSFIQHLALSMLPPFLPSIVDIDAFWKPSGWPSDTD